MNRSRAIANRWISLLLCGLLSCLVWIVIKDAARTALESSVTYLGRLKPNLILSSIIVPAILLGIHYGHGRWRGFLGIRHFWGYPPLWVSVVVAILLLKIVGGADLEEIKSIVSLSVGISLVPWLAVAFAITLAFRFIARADVRKHARPDPAQAPQQDYDVEFNSLIAWIKDDTEIDHPLQDRFGHDEIARRIVKRLLNTDDEAPTIAVVGPMGSGKSTIRRLVQHQLRNKDRIEIVHLSLWPFDSSRAAVAGILRAAIQGLAKHVNTLSLTGLSDRYVSVVEGLGGWLHSLIRVVQPESQPEDLVKSLTEVATAAGIRVVLWIEDMERFSGADLDPNNASKLEAETLGPIHSLLHMLDRCPSISVVVSD
ncbi:MAG TPA: AAA family ATPase, partial [Phycisphaerales bacterium]|nr:AAA family ATPase [Phycisphaerales bacterium]